MSFNLRSTALTFALLFVGTTTFAADEYNVSKGVTTAGVPLGLHGVDAVALTTLGAVAEGDATFTVTHDGAAYYFASQESADTFSSDPEGYLPRYGGFCAYAVALGKKFDGDPMFADIVDGKLYLFVNGAVFERYLADREAILAKAEQVWPSIRNKAVGDL
ncbi:MAG: YHS domain-containing (seleno)protein [Woeseiaceae bacterium]|nr:YHS domain-containing (seleno)protein [Woeseiaceae bacterium]